MGTLLCWIGLTIIEFTKAFPLVPAGQVVGAIFMLIGVVFIALEKRQ